MSWSDDYFALVNSRKKEKDIAPVTQAPLERRRGEGPVFAKETYQTEQYTAVGQQVTDRVSSWMEDHSNFLTGYNDRFAGRKGDFTDGYVTDSQNYLDTVSRQTRNFDSESNAIKEILGQYGSYLNPEWVSAVTKALDDAKKQQEQVRQAAQQDASFWAQFTPNEEQTAAGYTTEKLYQEWQAGQQRYAEDLALDLDAAKDALGALKKEKEAREQNIENLNYDLNAGLEGLEALKKEKESFEAAQYDRQIAELEKQIERAEYVQGYEGYMKNMDAKDYAAKSQYVSTRTNVAKEDARWGLYRNKYDESKLFGDFLYDYINRNQDALDVAMVNDVASDAYFLGFDKGFLQSMTDDEIGVYNYLYKTQGKDSANAFLSYIETDLEGRRRIQEQAEWAAYAKENPGAASVFSVLTSPMKGLSYIGQAADMMDDGKLEQNAGYNRHSYMNTAIRSQVSSMIEKSGKWGKVGSFAYNTGMSMADFLLTTAVSGGNQGLSLAIMGTGAAADATLAAKDRGLSDKQAFTIGTVAGAAEVAMEKISLGAWLEGDMSEGALRYVLKNAFSESLEETGTGVANLLADVMIAGDKSEWNTAMQAYIHQGKTKKEAFGLVAAEQAAKIGLDALGGFLSGSTIGGGTSAAAKVYGAVTGNNVASAPLNRNEQADFQVVFAKYKGTKFEDAAKKTIQSAIDAGVNNTNSVYDLVDMAAHVSADTRKTFTFKSGEQITKDFIARQTKEIAKLEGVKNRTAEQDADLAEMKDLLRKVESGEVVVDGDITADGIVLNLDSAKPLNRVVGHEITHSFEPGKGKNSKEYTELRDSLFAYAKTKGRDIDAELAVRKAQYAGVANANPEAELVADLVGDFLFTDTDYVKKLSTEHRNVFQKLWDEIKYLCKIATAGSREARELARVEKTFAEVYRTEGNSTVETKHSLSIKHTDGSVEELADARSLTNEQAVGYLQQAKSGTLQGGSYIPVRKDTPQVIIDTLAEAGERVNNFSLVMQVRKAQQAMSSENPGNRSGKHGSNVRKHSLRPQEVIEIVNNLDDPNTIILQTNRRGKNGVPLPNNVAVFVEYDNNGTEGLAVIEFESSIDPEYIGTEFGETGYHTVVTVFEPDTERNGMPFDYVEELLANPNNIELKIEKRQPEGSATREKHPNTSDELPFHNSIRSEREKVNTKYSLSKQEQKGTNEGAAPVVGWDGREVVKEATGPSVTVDGKKYLLLGYDAKGLPVYEKLRETEKTTQSVENGGEIGYSKRRYTKAFFAENVFPPYNESHSDSHEVAERWARSKKGGDERKALLSHHNEWYVIQAFDDMKYGYQIIRKLTAEEFQREEKYYDTITGYQSLQNTFGKADARDYRRSSDGNAGYRLDNDTFEHRGKNRAVHGLGEIEVRWGKAESNEIGDHRSGSSDRGRRNEPSVNKTRLDELGARAKWLRAQLKRDSVSKAKKTEYRRELREIRKEMEERMSGYFPSRDKRRQDGVNADTAPIVGWDGREVVKEATGPSVTVDGKKYLLLGYDAKGVPVYEDAWKVQEAQRSAAVGESGQAFRADVHKYTGAARKTVENAVNSGILNNTSGTHEFVELVAKLSQDKGIVFDFTDNQRLRQSSFALEGVTVNGFVNDSGVTVNVDSAKALNSVVGHEIAHVLEGTELYETLKSAIEAYAKGRGDYDARLEQLTKLYEGKPGYTGADAAAKIEKEVVADLVGDYLFTDKAFVEKLSTENRSLFQRIFDEIQYLCKLATAGSKEARQLERVKKIFEDAYRANRKNIDDSGAKYSLYSRPNFNQKEWSIVNRRKHSEFDNPKFDLDTDRKWLYANEKGSTVFAIYSKHDIDDPTVLYGSRGEAASNDYAIVTKFLDGGRNANRVTRNLDRILASIQSVEGNGSDGGAYIEGTQTAAGDVPIPFTKQGSNGRRNYVNGSENLRETALTEYNTEASDDSGASLITFSNDYNTIRNFIKEDLSAGKAKYSISKTEANRQHPAAWNIQGQDVTRGNGVEAQIDKKVVTPASGPSIAVDGKKYLLLGYDAKGVPVYEDAWKVHEAEAAKAAAQNAAAEQDAGQVGVANSENHDRMGARRKNTQFFAQIPKAKLTEYALNPLKAPDKAKAFKTALGYDLDNYEELMTKIKESIDESRFVEKGDLGHGMRYEYILKIKGPNGKTANVLTAWIQDGEGKRLTSIYVTKRETIK